MLDHNNPAFITDMVMDGVHENDRIDFLQRPFLPFFYDGQDFIRDPADGAVRNLDVIEFSHMAFDIIRSHSFGIHGDDLFFHVLSDRILTLFDDLWFKLPFPVSWDINLHIAVAGMHGLLGMTISGIIRFLVPIIILGISQFLIHFLIQGTFQDDGHHIPHKGIDIRSILDRYIVLFQVVAHHFPKSCFLWGILFSCHKINLQTGKSILHQFEGLHKLWDTPEVFPDARYQRCTVHFYRNIFSVTPRNKMKTVAMMLKAIHAQESKEAAREKARQVAEKLKEMKLSSAAKKLQDGIEETLTYMDFPTQHWTRIRTNNTIERLNREIKRRTKAIGAFPDGQSALMLVCARLRHVAGTQWGTRRYMNMDHLSKPEDDLLSDIIAG